MSAHPPGSALAQRQIQVGVRTQILLQGWSSGFHLGAGSPPPERVHLPLPAPGRGALKKTKKTALCPFSLTHCPQPQLCSSVFGPPPRDLQPPPGDGVGGAGGTRGLFPPKSPPVSSCLGLELRAQMGIWLVLAPFVWFPPKISCTRRRWRHRSPQPRAGRCPRDPSPP